LNRQPLSAPKFFRVCAEVNGAFLTPEESMLEVKKDKAAAPRKSAKVAAVASTYGPA
jgi:hypothetical protein